jgi:dihydrofolate reductase
MSKIVVTEFISLDGVIEDPTWSAPFWHDDIGKFKYDELFASGAHLLGRVTYQGFAASWPPQSGDFADRMNGIPKYVVSTTLKKPEWPGSHVIKENVVEEISELKQKPDQDLLVAGSSVLAQTLAKHDLVDEYHLLVYPVVLGAGKRLFAEGTKAPLKLIDTKTFSTGVVALRYQNDKK